MKSTATDLLQLLAAKHAADVFVPECKDGPTHYGSHVRLDGWAMKRSWANPLVVGYEIKVSRSDFLKDDKWPAYLPMCNQLYFVCPTGLIQPPEVPAEVGLLWASKNGTRLYTKAKAAHREVEIPEEVWRYVLMCRAKITREHGNGSTRQFWEEWLKQRKLDRWFGGHVSKAIRQQIETDILKVREENQDLQHKMESYDDIRRLLTELDINPDSWRVSRYDVQRRIEAARNAIPPNLLKNLESVARAAGEAKKAIEQLEPVCED